MLRNLRKPHVVLGITLVLLAGFATVSAAGTCVKKLNKCTATTSIKVKTSPPYIICLAGDDNIEITSSAQCRRGGSAGPVYLLRCSSDDAPFKYSGTDGVSHKIGLTAGSNWGQAVNNCNVVVYENSRS